MINAMTYSLSFDDNGFESSAGSSSGCAIAAGSSAGHTSPTTSFEGINSEAGSADLFEKLCNKNMYSDESANDLWDDKEQTIDFAPNAHKR